MRSTLLVYTQIEDLEKKAAVLISRLKDRRISCGIRVGRTRKSIVKGLNKKRRLEIPLGCGFLAIDICKVVAPTRHIKVMESKLHAVLKECDGIGLLDDRMSPQKRIDITAMVGGEDEEWMPVFYFKPETLALLGAYNTGIRIDVWPA